MLTHSLRHVVVHDAEGGYSPMTESAAILKQIILLWDDQLRELIKEKCISGKQHNAMRNFWYKAHRILCKRGKQNH